MNSTAVILIPTYAFTRKSAGIYSQHKLCNILRKLGFDAYLVIIQGQELVNKEWDTPIWPGTKVPVFSIGIYSELIHGNPLKTSYCIYWIMGNFILPPKKLRKECHFFFWNGYETNSLRLNNLDVDYFMPIGKVKREKYAIYKGKNRDWDIPKMISSQSIEIGRFGATAVSRVELRNILQKAKALIIAEDSLIIEEAIIAGCPVIVEPGTQIMSYSRKLPSLYIRAFEADWPDESILLAQIEASRMILIESSKKNDETVQNLTALISEQIKFSLPHSTPLTHFRIVSIIQIVYLRLKSGYSKGGLKSLFFVVFDALKL